jgi:hypothetical protein
MRGVGTGGRASAVRFCVRLPTRFVAGVLFAVCARGIALSCVARGFGASGGIGTGATRVRDRRGRLGAASVRVGALAGGVGDARITDRNATCICGRRGVGGAAVGGTARALRVAPAALDGLDGLVDDASGGIAAGAIFGRTRELTTERTGVPVAVCVRARSNAPPFGNPSRAGAR